MADSWKFPVEPSDPYNQTLLARVHPGTWKNPEPAGMYNLVVIGAGTAGLISALGAAGLGAKVALAERHLMGGDCLNTGCVPSKSLIRSSRLAQEVKTAGHFGLAAGPRQEKFSLVMERLRRIRSEISRHDSAERCAQAGVDVFLGEARFTGADRVEVAGKTLRFKKAIIAAGARAAYAAIEGLETAGFQTNETIFNLTRLPPRLLIIGGGPVGSELGQAFRRLGSEVSIIQNTRLLPGEEPEVSELLARIFEREGIGLRLNAEPVRAMKSGRSKAVAIRTGGGEEILEADEILLGAGRRPNVEGLGLETAGVAFDPRRGIRVDDFLRTTNRRIYAAGDICLDWKFTHAAEASARIALRNALFAGRKRLSALNMPWCTYTSPEIAHAGWYEGEARQRGWKTTTLRVNMEEVDRALIDGEEEGFIKVLVKRNTDRILGVTLVSAHAGEIIGEMAVAMAAGMGLGKLASVIHPYPTQAEVVKRAADAYNRTRLTPVIKFLLSSWLDWRRR